MADQGLPAGWRFAQFTYDESFSFRGGRIYTENLGIPISTRQDLIDALNAGIITPEDVPVQLVYQGDTPFVLNTRTTSALLDAGYTPSDIYYSSGSAERLASQLARNPFGAEGAPFAIANTLTPEQIAAYSQQFGLDPAKIGTTDQLGFAIKNNLSAIGNVEVPAALIDGNLVAQDPYLASALASAKVPTTNIVLVGPDGVSIGTAYDGPLLSAAGGTATELQTAAAAGEEAAASSRTLGFMGAGYAEEALGQFSNAVGDSLGSLARALTSEQALVGFGGGAMVGGTALDIWSNYQIAQAYGWGSYEFEQLVGPFGY